MTVYLVAIFFLTLSHFFSIRFLKPKQKFLECLADALLIFLIMALRKETVGTDTPQYKIIFEQIVSSNGDISQFGQERGFVYLNILVSKIFGDNFQWMIVFSSLIIVSSFAFFVWKNSPNYFVSFLVFLLSNILISYESMMRGAIAFSIVLWGYGFLKKKNYFAFLFFVLLGMTFHLSAFFSILLIPCSSTKWKKKTFAISCVTCLFVSLITRPLFFLATKYIPSFAAYANSELSGTNFFGAAFQFGFPLLILCFATFVYSKNRFLIKNPDDQNEYSLLLFIELLFVTASASAMWVKIFSRVASVFALYQTLLVPEVFKNTNLFSKKKFYISSASAVLLGYLCYFLIINLVRPEWFSGVPYLFFWED